MTDNQKDNKQYVRIRRKRNKDVAKAKNKQMRRNESKNRRKENKRRIQTIRKTMKK